MPGECGEVYGGRGLRLIAVRAVLIGELFPDLLDLRILYQDTEPIRHNLFNSRGKSPTVNIHILEKKNRKIWKEKVAQKKKIRQ